MRRQAFTLAGLVRQESGSSKATQLLRPMLEQPEEGPTRTPDSEFAFLKSGAIEPHNEFVSCAAQPPRLKKSSCYWLGPLDAASASAIRFDISAFTASRLKLAPRCMGG